MSTDTVTECIHTNSESRNSKCYSESRLHNFPLETTQSHQRAFHATSLRHRTAIYLLFFKYLPQRSKLILTGVCCGGGQREVKGTVTVRVGGRSSTSRPSPGHSWGLAKYTGNYCEVCWEDFSYSYIYQGWDYYQDMLLHACDTSTNPSTVVHKVAD